jgi:membrane associated rhomboid family serine protease
LDRRFYEDHPATSILLLLIIGFFVLEILAVHKLSDDLDFHASGLIAFGGEGASQALRLLGALDTERVRDGHEYWRLFSAVVLHGGLIHLFFNLSVLFDLGRYCESNFSSSKYFTFFVICGLAGSLASFGWSVAQDSFRMSVGASGALAGLIGACFTYSAKERLHDMTSYFTRWIVQIALLSFICWDSIDHAAHVGGFVVGAGLGLSVDRYTSSETAERWKHPAYAAGSLLGVSLVLAVFNYFRHLWAL